MLHAACLTLHGLPYAKLAIDQDSAITLQDVYDDYSVIE